MIFLVFCVTIEIVRSDDSFRIGISKLNSTTESSLWTLFLLFQLHFTMRRKKYLLKQGDLLMARTGATFGKTLYVPDNSPAVYASFLIKIELDNSVLLNRFYWHFAQSAKYWEQANNLVSTGGQPQFNTNAVKRVSVPVPPLAEQERIVKILDRFEKLCNDISDGLPAEIEARQKQYEYYRDKLLTFKELQK